MNQLVVFCVVLVICSTSVSALKCRFSLLKERIDESRHYDNYTETQCRGSCLKIRANVDGQFIRIITTNSIAFSLTVFASLSKAVVGGPAGPATA